MPAAYSPYLTGDLDPQRRDAGDPALSGAYAYGLFVPDIP
jgi:hypothetical protein